MSAKSAVSLWQLFVIFLRLGCTSFGGPVAHLAYFRHEFVEKRRWYSEQHYAQTVALCQFLPGPASSQVGIAIGMERGGYCGALLSWLGFTLPSALLLLAFAYVFVGVGDSVGYHWIAALKLVAVAVVAQAVWSMAKSLCPDKLRVAIALLTAISLLLLSGVVVQLLLMLIAALIGWRFIRAQAVMAEQASAAAAKPTGVAPVLMFAVFAGLLVLLPALAADSDSSMLKLFDHFYRAGALVFGGGHVVLPLLQAELVPAWVNQDAFLAGYGMAQAVPGPLFTLATYLGAVTPLPAWQGAFVATLAIFLPAFLLLFAALPLWLQLSRQAGMRRAIAGINAAVVGILLAALYNPVFSSAVKHSYDMAGVVLAFVALAVWRWPPYLVVLLAALAGIARHYLHLFWGV
ncbi:chromate efflux transporter [Rheinheimera pleomorphica]|uniref:chromate efflux transporter n=1 Tax=Rheinheimera pleomorphica TaxID=2703963 RepID=UPI001420E4B9|nr:chromate efflux transporter [Rheinheimera pleomorphica]